MQRGPSTVASQASALERGKSAYNAGNLTGAVSFLKEVVRGCCPNSTVTDGPCTCRDLLDALQKKDLRAQLTARCKCKAKLDKRCRDQNHMDALNLLTLIAMKKSKGRSATATSLASEMIWRNPRDPSGYLRLGQILRRDQKPDIAFEAYNQGAMLVAEKYPDHPRLEVMRAQASAVEKVMHKIDPMQTLPLELVNMIFTMLDTTEVCRCMQVSKAWKAKLESADARDVWLHQSYTLRRTKHGLASKVFHRYIKAYTCGHLKSFSIKDESGFMAKNFALFSRCCNELQHLTLKGNINLGNSLATTTIPYRLETLHIGNRVDYDLDGLERFLTYCSKTLRELSLLRLQPRSAAADAEDFFWVPNWPDLPLVETLRLSGIRRLPINLSAVADRTPNVRELWIDKLWIQMQASDVPEAGFWPKAEYLYCRDVVRYDRTSRGLSVFGSTEHVTEVFIDRCELDLFFGHKGLYEGSYDGGLAKLESLSLTNNPGAGCETLERIITPSLESGKLKALQLNPYPFRLLPGPSSPNVGDYDWLRNKCVKHLTVGGLNLRHGLIDLDAALTAIVGQCGALESLDIGQEAVQAATLVAFIKKKENEKARGGGRVRVLYHDNPELPTYDLQAWVREKDLGEVHRRPYPGSSEELWRKLFDW